MGILQDMSEGVRSRMGALTLVGLGMLSAAGCSTQLDGTGVATDSRETVTSVDDDLASLTTPSIFAEKHPISLEDQGLHRVALRQNRSYAVEMPAGTFVELIGAVNREDAGFMSPKYYRTDDSFVFQVPDNDLSRYEVWIEESDFCNRGWSPHDGIYFIVVDTADNRNMVSAVKLPVPDLDEHPSKAFKEMIFLQTPDGAIHHVPEPIEKWRNDVHYTPDHIRWINGRIDSAVSADSLGSS